MSNFGARFKLDPPRRARALAKLGLVGGPASAGFEPKSAIRADERLRSGVLGVDVLVPLDLAVESLLATVHQALVGEVASLQKKKKRFQKY